MRTDNIFNVGGWVAGESMIGYQRYYEDLLEQAFLQERSRGISVSGMHGFGKTSLMKQVIKEAKKRPDLYIPVYVVLSDLGDEDNNPPTMFRLIQAIVRILERAVLECSLKDSYIEEGICEIRQSQKDGVVLRETFKQLIEDVGVHRHMILVIDEFDTANTFALADIELLRTIMMSPDHNTSLFLISRRQIQYIIADNHNNSHLPANVYNVYICGFNEDDRTEFYRILETQYGVLLSDEEKNYIFYYAGILPSIYSRIGNRIVSDKLKKDQIDIQDICNRIMNEINIYYNLVLERLKHDQIEKDLYATIIGPKIGLSEQRIYALQSIGYLMYDGEGKYYAFSPCFSELLSNEKIEASEWESIIQVAKEMKNIVRVQLERFGILDTDKEKYECFLENMYAQKGQSYDPKQYNHFIKNTERHWNQKLTLLDVMSFKHMVHAIIAPLWDECFSQYFGQKNYRNWEMLFELCGKARDPLAHGQKELLSESECTMVTSSCNEILTTLSKAKQIDKDKISPPTWLQNLLTRKQQEAFSVMVYTDCYRDEREQIVGFRGYIDGTDQKGMLHITQLKKDGFISQEIAKQFAEVLEKQNKIQVSIVGMSQKGMQFSLFDVQPDFDSLMQKDLKQEE